MSRKDLATCKILLGNSIKMDPQSLNRALMSSALWFGVTWGVALVNGVNPPVMEVATDAGLMAIAALASDAAHSALSVVPTAVSSAAGAGAFYAAAQRLYRGDTDSSALLINFGLASANDYAVEVVGSALA